MHLGGLQGRVGTLGWGPEGIASMDEQNRQLWLPSVTEANDGRDLGGLGSGLMI